MTAQYSLQELKAAASDMTEGMAKLAGEATETLLKSLQNQEVEEQMAEIQKLRKQQIQKIQQIQKMQKFLKMLMMRKNSRRMNRKRYFETESGNRVRNKRPLRLFKTWII